MIKRQIYQKQKYLGLCTNIKREQRIATTLNRQTEDKSNLQSEEEKYVSKDQCCKNDKQKKVLSKMLQ